MSKLQPGDADRDSLPPPPIFYKEYFGFEVYLILSKLLPKNINIVNIKTNFISRLKYHVYRH